MFAPCGVHWKITAAQPRPRELVPSSKECREPPAGSAPVANNFNKCICHDPSTEVIYIHMYVYIYVYIYI